MSKCQICGEKEATVHLTDLILNEETHLCDKCAEEEGAVMPTISVSTVLSSLIEQQEAETESEFDGVTCPMCGRSYDEIRKQGKVGCARCYEIFAKAIIPFVERIQGSSEHRGKAPRRLGKTDIEFRRKLMNLKQKLKVAVMEEGFELAANLRDEIKNLQAEENES